MAQQRRGHCRHGIPAMVAHEAYPGPPPPAVTAQELGSEVRRHLWTPGHGRGLGALLRAAHGRGRVTTARRAGRLFQLVNLLWRAIRVVLDVGLHTRGMTPAEAVDYMVEHLPIERPSAEAEVRRYCAWPTYQLCYAVGRRELLRLRDAYRERDRRRLRAAAVPRRAAGLRRAARLAGALGHGARRVNGRNRRGPPAEDHRPDVSRQRKRELQGLRRRSCPRSPAPSAAWGTGSPSSASTATSSGSSPGSRAASPTSSST